ncbi:DUF2470 domain-containing protein [Streptomyces sp. VRA16 Mangrove soil]|uniref:DUF2470 domain-containing protein n=1 Tax=Streptomyces sp. VRA16 Mangrove soil TaxID=2817434 RepID=UPI001A9EAD37|nr:DUF2470 domain-containing protein [Streptomyces sp. VRA16 Mangrove soil]MBO1330552.1 DUF2470 domain-containing protein [Streptomyces sp. VRA16 Mangrove soil]
MGVRQIAAAVPTAAARARSVLAAAWTCGVTTDVGQDDLVAAHRVAAEDGTVRITAPAESVLAAAVLCAPHGRPTTLLEFADVAPVPVRDRVRARVWLSGELVPDGEELVLRTERAVLQTRTERIGIDLDELAATDPDPLTLAEPRLLTHLADSHPEAVEQLTRLVTPDSLHRVVRVQPLAVDRHGLTLRLERARGQADVRIPFHSPADDLASLTERMHCLLASAQSVSRRGR